VDNGRLDSLHSPPTPNAKGAHSDDRINNGVIARSLAVQGDEAICHTSKRRLLRFEFLRYRSGQAARNAKGAHSDDRGAVLYLLCKVSPFRVDGINQIDLLLARTSFDLFLSGDGRVDITGLFKVDQFVDVITLRKFAPLTFFVLSYTAMDVVRHASIENGIVFVGENVDIVLVSHIVRNDRINNGVIARSLAVQGDEAIFYIREEIAALRCAPFATPRARTAMTRGKEQ
jgi:hypothetical protein